MATAELLGQQQKLLEELLAVLEQEREELCQAHPDGTALETLAHTKRDYLKAIELVETHSATARANASSEPENKALLQMQYVARKVHHANSINGKLLHSRMVWNQRILNFIREAQDFAVYGADGRSDPRSSTLSSRA